jgi:hypothetical protein
MRPHGLCHEKEYHEKDCHEKEPSPLINDGDDSVFSFFPEPRPGQTAGGC